MDATSALKCDSQPQVLVASIRFSFSSFSFPYIIFYSLLCCTQILVHQSLKSESLSAFLVVEVFWGYRYLAVAMDVERFD